MEDQEIESHRGSKIVITEEQFQAVVWWVEGVTGLANNNGRILTDEEKEIAREIGIEQVDSIRIYEVDKMPDLPDSLVNLASIYLDPRQSLGLTLDHSILIRRGSLTESLLRHELCHVRQVEDAGGVKEFLLAYITQVIEFGYEKAPMEVEARTYG